MRVLTIDCSSLGSEQEFWAAYLAATKPEGEGYFGENLDAFWDALNGGPGWPGECEIYFGNTNPVKLWRSGNFYKALTEICSESRLVRIHIE